MAKLANNLPYRFFVMKPEGLPGTENEDVAEFRLRGHQHVVFPQCFSQPPNRNSPAFGYKCQERLIKYHQALEEAPPQLRLLQAVVEQARRELSLSASRKKAW